jgi:mono/diheme cytochrome c family protein
MNYPIWYLPETGGGILIALIAILHVYVSHFAVGGGLYLIYAEKKGLRENSQAILDFTKRHARFFILLTLVFGSITGVGIWFIIALVNPAATSFLIHNFVFGWAIEWVFFLVEIAAAFVYYYMFGRMDSATHLKVGWIYFVAAWMSLFVINGIIGVMLTPGSWAEDFDFWRGIFNPSFWPSLFFRTFVALLVAGCYGYLSAAFTADQAVREKMTRFSAIFGMLAFLAAIPAGLWYLSALPEQAHALVLGKSPTIQAALAPTAVGLAGIFFILLGAGIIRPAYNLKPVAFLALACGLVFMGGFEWVREAARRPYVINEVIYSNSIFKKDLAEINQNGYLPSALWVAHQTVTEENLAEAGEELFIHQCYACHTVGGWNNDIIAATETMSSRALVAYIGKIHQIRYFMPPFAGTDAEIRALAAYIAGTLHGKEIDEPTAQAAGDPLAPGVVLFEENCSSCHGVEEMTAPLAGLDQAAIETMLLTLDEISDEMEPFAGSDQERQQLALFLFALNNPDAVVGPTAGESAEEAGLILFDENCAACHSLDEVRDAWSGSSQGEIVEMLGTLDQISEEMEPFAGSKAEADQLAAFLAPPGAGAAPAPAAATAGGQEVFANYCAMCHSLADVEAKTAGQDRQELHTLLGRLNELVKAMPPFTGTEEERQMLADYLHSLQQGDR